MRGDVTRERILEAAAQAFDRRGYLGVNLNDVVQELGLTKGALYHFFPNKERLATEIVRRHFAGWERLASRVLGEHDNLVDALIDMSYRVGRSYQTDSFARAANRLSNERNLIRTELPEPFVGWIERVTQLLETAKARGQVRTHDVLRNAPVREQQVLPRLAHRPPARRRRPRPVPEVLERASLPRGGVELVEGAQRFPRSACSRSIASKSALKFPSPKPRAPWRSITSKKSVGRSWAVLVKICSR